jgi:polyhydroxybutyrate depolymerase
MWLLLLACADPVSRVDLDAGTYYARTPAGWDGASALPAVVHFHGAGGHPDQYLDSPALTGAVDDAGALLLLPEGEGGHWATDPGWRDGRDEIAFLDDLLDDASARWPVDAARIYLMGFSIGGAHVSQIACEASERFAAVAAISGGFWAPVPPACPAAPIPVSRTHGRADGTWPLAGRCFQESDDGDCLAGQAPHDVDRARWFEHLGCEAGPAVVREGPLTCEVWTCAGAALRTCLHDEGHTLLDGWASRHLRWLLRWSRR